MPVLYYVQARRAIAQPILHHQRPLSGGLEKMMTTCLLAYEKGDYHIVKLLKVLISVLLWLIFLYQPEKMSKFCTKDFFANKCITVNCG
jgi:hypothetical protein